MEGKRAAAIVALCMLMLLSGQQQVAAKRTFCACYLPCYDQCRVSLPRWICLTECVVSCKTFGVKVIAPTSAADCRKTCLISFCGSATADTSGVAACVDDCTKNQSQYAKHL